LQTDGKAISVVELKSFASGRNTSSKVVHGDASSGCIQFPECNQSPGCHTRMHYAWPRTWYELYICIRDCNP